MLKNPSRGVSPPPTMADVGRRAGVSATAVSLALRNHSSISRKTRERILKAQCELGYRINRFAREMVRARSGSRSQTRLEQLAFCLLGVSFQNDAYVPFLHGIANECREQNLRFFAQPLEAPVNRDFSLPPILQYGNVDGIIVSGMVDDAAVACFQRQQIPLVVLGNYDLKTPVTRVELDMHQVGSALAERVLEHGHRQIAFVAEKLDYAYERLCLEGIQMRLSRDGISLPDKNIISTGQFYSSGAAFIEPFLRLNPFPTALITTDTRVADDCVAELRIRQIEVPGRVEVVSLTAQDRRVRSRCRALNLGLERFGRLAVRRLAELVKTPGLAPSTSILTAVEWLEPPKSNL
ncbi:MAG: LacI family DNA-binding transcriptional regulator [Verrucomicrobia bacterium]|nr:LacI family DNA-binding transcriptional regulator [Verrucomicrobiota bacterium]